MKLRWFAEIPGQLWVLVGDHGEAFGTVELTHAGWHGVAMDGDWVTTIEPRERRAEAMLAVESVLAERGHAIQDRETERNENGRYLHSETLRGFRALVLEADNATVDAFYALAGQYDARARNHFERAASILNSASIPAPGGASLWNAALIRKAVSSYPAPESSLYIFALVLAARSDAEDPFAAAADWLTRKGVFTEPGGTTWMSGDVAALISDYLGHVCASSESRRPRVTSRLWNIWLHLSPRTRIR